jgi:hypothetical protein
MQDPALAPWVNTSPTHSLATSKPIVAECSQPSLTSTPLVRASVGRKNDFSTNFVVEKSRASGLVVT